MSYDSYKFGAEFRLQNRKQRNQDIQSRIAALYDQYLAEVQSNVVVEINELLACVASIQLTIDHEFSRKKDQAEAFRCLERRLSADFPEYKEKINRVMSSDHYEGLGTQKHYSWFTEFREAGYLYDSWKQAFVKFYALEGPHEIQDRLTHLAMSSIFRGGIGSHVWLRALLDDVLSGNIDLIEISDESTCEYWVDLRTEDSAVVRNFRNEQGEFATRLWRIDAHTLVLMVSVIDALKEVSGENRPTYHNIIEHINLWLSIELSKTIKVKELCRLAALHLEVRHALPVTQPMLPTITNEFSSACMTRSDLLGLTKCSDVSVNNIQVTLPPRFPRSVSASATRYRPEIDDVDNEFLKRLLHAIEFDESPIDALVALSAESNISARMALISWYNHLLSERGLKCSSVATYHSAVARRWLSAVGHAQLDLCDEAYVNDIFDEVFDDISITDRHFDYVVERAQDLFRFIKMRYSWRFEMPAALRQRAGLTNFIRADVIPVWVVGRAVSLLLAREWLADMDEQIMLALILIIAHRTGLRISEILKLRLADVEVSSSWWVAIKESEFGSNKSDSASRRVPLGILLKPRELDLFKEYFSSRASFYVEHNPSRILVFGVHGTPSGLFNRGYVSKIISDILSQFYGRRVVFHSLRHTALTALEAVMASDQDSIARVISGYSADQIQFVRDKIFGKSCSSVYFQLAGLAGHIDPGPTLQNYMHATSIIFYRRLSHTDKSIDPLFLRNVAGVSKTLITRRTEGKADQIDYGAVCSILDTRIRRLTSDRVMLDHREFSVDPIPNDIGSSGRTDVMTCYRVLHAIERGSTYEEAAVQFNANPEKVGRWVHGARWTLGRYRTVKNRSRLIDENRKIASGTVLISGLPNSSGELSEALDAVVRFRDVYRSDRQLLFWATDYVLSRASVENSGVRFTSRDDLTRFLSLMTLYFPPSRFLLILHPLMSKRPSDSLERWEQAHADLPCRLGTQSVRNARQFPDGRAILVLRHPDEELLIYKAESEKGRQYRKYSSCGLQFIFHMLAIMMPKSPVNDERKS